LKTKHNNIIQEHPIWFASIVTVSILSIVIIVTVVKRNKRNKQKKQIIKTLLLTEEIATTEVFL
jgi:hypothetical protein